jgi:hypothetical protein
MANEAPYSEYVGASDPLLLLETTPKKIAELVQNWNSEHWSKSYAPGAWTAAQLILHLAHDEIGWSKRIRLAAILNDYVVQPYDGALWVDLESPIDPKVALDAYMALRQLNMNLYKRVDSKQRARPIYHPENGDICIDWMLRLLAGHDLHHFQHLQTIAKL